MLFKLTKAFSVVKSKLVKNKLIVQKFNQQNGSHSTCAAGSS